MKKLEKYMPMATAVIAVAVAICAVVIAAKSLGLVDGYDFGAGAYYYADIPGFEKLLDEEAYSTSVPLWVHIALFLSWGYLMYRLWVWVEKKK